MASAIEELDAYLKAHDQRYLTGPVVGMKENASGTDSIGKSQNRRASADSIAVSPDSVASKSIGYSPSITPMSLFPENEYFSEPSMSLFQGTRDLPRLLLRDGHFSSSGYSSVRRPQPRRRADMIGSRGDFDRARYYVSPLASVTERSPSLDAQQGSDLSYISLLSPSAAGGAKGASEVPADGRSEMPTHDAGGKCHLPEFLELSETTGESSTQESGRNQTAKDLQSTVEAVLKALRAEGHPVKQRANGAGSRSSARRRRNMEQSLYDAGTGLRFAADRQAANTGTGRDLRSGRRSSRDREGHRRRRSLQRQRYHGSRKPRREKLPQERSVCITPDLSGVEIAISPDISEDDSFIRSGKDPLVSAIDTTEGQQTSLGPEGDSAVTGAENVTTADVAVSISGEMGGASSNRDGFGEAAEPDSSHTKKARADSNSSLPSSNSQEGRAHDLSPPEEPHELAEISSSNSATVEEESRQPEPLKSQAKEEGKETRVKAKDLLPESSVDSGIAASFKRTSQASDSSMSVTKASTEVALAMVESLLLEKRELEPEAELDSSAKKENIPENKQAGQQKTGVAEASNEPKRMDVACASGDQRIGSDIATEVVDAAEKSVIPEAETIDQGTQTIGVPEAASTVSAAVSVSSGPEARTANIVRATQHGDALFAPRPSFVDHAGADFPSRPPLLGRGRFRPKKSFSRKNMPPLSQPAAMHGTPGTWQLEDFRKELLLQRAHIDFSRQAQSAKMAEDEFKTDGDNAPKRAADRDVSRTGKRFLIHVEPQATPEGIVVAAVEQTAPAPAAAAASTDEAATSIHDASASMPPAAAAEPTFAAAGTAVSQAKVDFSKPAIVPCDADSEGASAGVSVPLQEKQAGTPADSTAVEEAALPPDKAGAGKEFTVEEQALSCEQGKVEEESSLSRATAKDAAPAPEPWALEVEISAASSMARAKPRQLPAFSPHPNFAHRARNESIPTSSSDILPAESSLPAEDGSVPAPVPAPISADSLSQSTAQEAENPDARAMMEDLMERDRGAQNISSFLPQGPLSSDELSRQLRVFDSLVQYQQLELRALREETAITTAIIEKRRSDKSRSHISEVHAASTRIAAAAEPVGAAALDITASRTLSLYKDEIHVLPSVDEVSPRNVDRLNRSLHTPVIPPREPRTLAGTLSPRQASRKLREIRKRIRAKQDQYISGKCTKSDFEQYMETQRELYDAVVMHSLAASKIK